MGRKMIETCNHCGKKEVTDLGSNLDLHGKTKMSWAVHSGKYYTICDTCTEEFKCREKKAEGQVFDDFIAECREDDTE